MKIGYARVSTNEQELGLQITALKKAGCENVYYEKSTDRRCTLIDLYNFCRRLEIFSRDNEAITIFYKFATV